MSEICSLCRTDHKPLSRKVADRLTLENLPSIVNDNSCNAKFREEVYGPGQFAVVFRSSSTGSECPKRSYRIVHSKHAPDADGAYLAYEKARENGAGFAIGMRCWFVEGLFWL